MPAALILVAVVIAVAAWSTLFDEPLVAKRRTSRALVHVTGCPVCGLPLVETTAGQPALLRHGGYGATNRTTWRYCRRESCRFQFQSEVVEIRPDRRTA